ncbi:MAG: lytic transglycosylase domain-containing protein [Rhizobiaceae bacterium]|nr:lytic transglycosylase domain-containing protein [Rhizobiaceae bacterium]
MPAWRHHRLALLFAIPLAMVPVARFENAEMSHGPQPASPLDAGTTSAIPAAGNRFVAPREAPAGSLGELKSGLDMLAARDLNGARAVRDGLPETELDRHILDWAIAVYGGGAVSSTEIAEALAALRGWPGADALRRNQERALARESPAPSDAVAAFAERAPVTLEGVRLLARAELALGNTDGARAVVTPFWRTEKLEAADEAGFLAEFGDLIAPADHRFRMERMLYAERVRSAERVAARAGAEALAKAWAAVLRNDRNAGSLLDAVPETQRSAGYFFALAKYDRLKNQLPEAAAAMLKAPSDPAALVDPDAWWIERRVLSRKLVDAGDDRTAYAVAAAHAAESPVNAADAEFHAGWYALRGLRDAKAASLHFSRIAEIAGTPISLSRAYYWLGRAADAGGSGKAADYYEKAAAFPTTFYGQIAAQKIGRREIGLASPVASDAEKATFNRREAVHAIRRLEMTGYERYAEALYRDLALQLTSPGEMALLVAMAEQRGNHFLALRVAKLAASRGVDVGSLAHPVGAIPPTAEISATGRALAYAVARQESEFNVAAISRAGARGLLQLLPGTAKDVARRAGLPYSEQRLTTDAGYNATLGAAFLGEQLDRFNGSYVLTFAGYNAGPRRALEWVKRYGDPRGKDVDAVVDWIESIPFSETRSYVQRVMENYQVYKMRLAGSFDIAADLSKGR